MKIVSKTGASILMHPVYGQVTAGADGAFEVADELGRELLGFSTQWAPEDELYADADGLTGVVELYDPALAAEALAQLREDIAVLKAGGTVDDPPPTSPLLVPADWRPGRWQPDQRTLALASMVVRNDQVNLAAFWALLVQLDEHQVTP